LNPAYEIYENKNIISPIFKVPCVRVKSWVTANVLTNKQGTGKTMKWAHDEKLQEVPFALKDATGIVFILPALDLETGSFINASEGYLKYMQQQKGAIADFVPEDSK